MTGHVPHPDREPLHGITVVVQGNSGRTWVGRYHERSEQGLVMRDVAIHEPQTASISQAEWIGQLRRFGVTVAERYLVLPPEEIGPISVLEEWSPEAS